MLKNLFLRNKTVHNISLQVDKRLVNWYHHNLDIKIQNHNSMHLLINPVGAYKCIYNVHASIYIYLWVSIDIYSAFLNTSELEYALYTTWP